MRRALLQFGRERVNAFNTFSRERERELLGVEFPLKM